MASSMAALHSSRMTKKRSKRDMIGAEMSTFALRDLLRSYLKPSQGTEKVDISTENLI
jgi:hypothetical protein